MNVVLPRHYNWSTERIYSLYGRISHGKFYNKFINLKANEYSVQTADIIIIKDLYAVHRIHVLYI